MGTFIFLYLPIILFIITCILSKYVIKDENVTVKDVIRFFVISFIPLINIIAIILDFSFIVKENEIVEKILNKKVW